MKTLLITVLLTLLITLGAGNQPASAGIYKCVDAGGGITYSQRECPLEQKTAKVLSNKGHAGDRTDCAVADPFIRSISTAMREGRSSGETFDHYGGMDLFSKQALGLLNYIYTYNGNQTLSLTRIASLTKTRCEAGSFGTMTCAVLPQIFLTEQGGCEPQNQHSSTNKDRQSNGDEFEEENYRAQRQD